MEIEQYIVSTDQQLVERALDGDTVAFEHLFNRYRDSIYQLYVQRTSGRTDDASDLLQETFVKVYLNMQRYDSRYTFGQWVYTIARNTFIDYMRRKRDDTVPIDRIGERVSSSWGGPTPEERMITDQSRARLESLLERMSPRYRKLIELRFFKEYSYEEIAAELQLPMGTVKTQIHRAREQPAVILRKADRAEAASRSVATLLIPAYSQIPNLLDRKSPHKADDPADTASVRVADSRPACGINEPLQTCKLEAETVRKQ
ncbi:MAG: RNA polymerase sigma factor [Alistipes ihumii]